jgi:hypothetical protein
LPWLLFVAILLTMPMWCLSLWASRHLTPARTTLLFMIEVCIGVGSAALLSGDHFGWPPIWYDRALSTQPTGSPTVALDMNGMRVIVAGGSRGIGRSIALAFAGQGASVSICARHPEALESTRKELAQTAAVAHASTCDLSQPADVRRYIEEAAAALNGLDVLVNNATGVFEPSDTWHSCLSVDLVAAVHACEATQPHLERSQRAFRCLW